MSGARQKSRSWGLSPSGRKRHQSLPQAYLRHRPLRQRFLAKPAAQRKKPPSKFAAGKLAASATESKVPCKACSPGGRTRHQSLPQANLRHRPPSPRSPAKLAAQRKNQLSKFAAGKLAASAAEPKVPCKACSRCGTKHTKNPPFPSKGVCTVGTDLPVQTPFDYCLFFPVQFRMASSLSASKRCSFAVSNATFTWLPVRLAVAGATRAVIFAPRQSRYR